MTRNNEATTYFSNNPCRNRSSDAEDHSHRTWEKLPGMAIDSYLPDNDQGRDERDWAQPDKQLQASQPPSFSSLSALKPPLMRMLPLVWVSSRN